MCCSLFSRGYSGTRLPVLLLLLLLLLALQPHTYDFCLRRPLILLFWAARHNDAEMQHEHDPLCGCMATAATKERCAALGPGRIQRAVAHQYVQESLLMVGSNRPLGQVCLVLSNLWRHKRPLPCC